MRCRRYPTELNTDLQVYEFRVVHPVFWCGEWQPDFNFLLLKLKGMELDKRIKFLKAVSAKWGESVASELQDELDKEESEPEIL